MTTATGSGGSGRPAHRGKVMGRLSELFAFKRERLNWRRALFVMAASLLLLIVFIAIDKEQYLLSATFAVLFVGVGDPGGAYGHRASHMAGFALVGAALTALGFGVGGAAWGWVVVAAFAVTLLAGLTIAFGLHRFAAALLLNIWFVVALSLAEGYGSGSGSNTWGQVLAWVVGAALWISFAGVLWLARGRKDQPPPVPEIPGDVSPRKLTRPLIMFAVIRALAVAITVAIAWGLDVSDADWMPIAALAAMKGSLDQTTFVAEQRLAGALIGAAAASVLLLTVANTHALEAAIIVAFTVGAAIHSANYALYCAAIAAGVLIAIDLPHPSDLGAEGRRVLFTFIGVGVAVVVMLLADLLAKHAAKAHPKPGSQPA